MKELEKEKARLRRVIFDLTLDKLILQEAARVSFCASRVDSDVSMVTMAIGG